MEDALFADKTIRRYFTHFSNQQWNKVARLTFTFAIQQLMKEEPSLLASDFSTLSIDTLQDLVGKFCTFILFEFLQRKTN